MSPQLESVHLFQCVLLNSTLQLHLITNLHFKVVSLWRGCSSDREELAWYSLMGQGVQMNTYNFQKRKVIKPLQLITTYLC